MELVDIFYNSDVNRIVERLFKNNNHGEREDRVRSVSDIALILDDEINRAGYNRLNREEVLNYFKSQRSLKLDVLLSSVKLFKRVEFWNPLFEKRNKQDENYVNGVVRFLFYYSLKQGTNLDIDTDVSRIFGDLIESFDCLVGRNVDLYAGKSTDIGIEINRGDNNSKNGGNVKRIRSRLSRKLNHYTLGGLLNVIGKYALENSEEGYPRYKQSNKAIKFVMKKDNERRVEEYGDFSISDMVFDFNGRFFDLYENPRNRNSG
ncbi:hypothetical protein HY498_01445 [Candidatus Woesearchaeota archaeon]|nr:hypothetical protein [Candidatus Woesearchaeota archaeon]